MHRTEGHVSILDCLNIITFRFIFHILSLIWRKLCFVKGSLSLQKFYARALSQPILQAWYAAQDSFALILVRLLSILNFFAEFLKVWVARLDNLSLLQTLHSHIIIMQVY